MHTRPREDAQPPQSDLLIGPEGDHIGTVAENHVNVVGHHREGGDLHAEEPGEVFQAVANPGPAMVVGVARDRIDAADLFGVDLFGPGRAGWVAWATNAITEGTSLGVRALGRVDRGGWPPRSPTHPRLHIKRTRFLTYDFAALRNRLWTIRGLGKP